MLRVESCRARRSRSQPFPSRPFKTVAPFGVGGPADICARFIGSRMQEPLGHSVAVENRPGGGAIVGTDAVAKSPPEGYTLLEMSNTHTVDETLFPKRPYELMRGLAPVTGVNYSDLLTAIHPTVPANSARSCSPGRPPISSSSHGR
jgi:tripartite-type tricarboxylate transporter receptor subunit TctC